MREILQSLLPSSGPVDESDPELAELCSIYAPPPPEDDLGDQANMVREQMLDMAQSVLGKNLDREAFKGIDSPEELMEALIQQVHTFQEARGCAAGRAPLSPSSIGPSAQGPGAGPGCQGRVALHLPPARQRTAPRPRA